MLMCGFWQSGSCLCLQGAWREEATTPLPLLCPWHSGEGAGPEETAGSRLNRLIDTLLHSPSVEYMFKCRECQLLARYVSTKLMLCLFSPLKLLC